MEINPWILPYWHSFETYVMHNCIWSEMMLFLIILIIKNKINNLFIKAAAVNKLFKKKNHHMNETADWICK